MRISTKEIFGDVRYNAIFFMLGIFALGLAFAFGLATSVLPYAQGGPVASAEVAPAVPQRGRPAWRPTGRGQSVPERHEPLGHLGRNFPFRIGTPGEHPGARRPPLQRAT